MVAEQGLVVAVLVPVEGFDFETTTFWVATDNARHSLVHGSGRGGGILRQEHDLISQVAPTLHTGKLEGGNTGLW